MAGEDHEILVQSARERVANRYSAPYLKNAILAGDWDSGRLVQDALAEVISERKALKEEGTIQDDE